MALSKTYVFLFLLFPAILFSQNENTKWCFSPNVGLDFSTNPPSLFTAANMVNNVICSSSIADAAGNLVLYSDGFKVYNRLHQVMSSLWPINGLSVQGVLVTKQPGNSSLYYVFTASADGINYAIVDMSLAAGLGSVTAKANLTGVPQVSKLAGTPHCNGNDLWIVSQDLNANALRAYQLTTTGLNTSPVLSTLGPAGSMNQGFLKFSPSGDKLAVSDFSITVYSFNSLSGIAASPVVLTTTNSILGLEFSPDGSKLYATRWGNSSVWQWDLCAGSTAAQQASKYLVTGSGSPKGGLERGPDGKIYIGRKGQTALSVINMPNAPGAACNFVEAGQSISPLTSGWDLPNQVKRRPSASISTYSTSTSGCSSRSFSTAGAWGGVIGCTTQTAVISWNFGDPASGSANTSNLSQPTHHFSSPGTYTVKLALQYTCGTDTVAQTVTVAPSPTLTVSGSLSLCEGKSTTLTAAGSAAGYTWTGSSGTQPGPVLVATPLVPGTSVYTVTGTGPTGCTEGRTVSLNVLPQPVLAVSGSTAVCQGSTATLSITGASSYTWTGGSTDHSITVPSSNTSYTVSGTGTNGCMRTVTVVTLSQPVPTVSVNHATTCPGKPVALTASGSPAGSLSYTWFPGWNTGASLMVSPSSTSSYSVTAELNGCRSTAVTIVTVTGLTEAVTAFLYNTPICEGPVYVQPQLAANFNDGGNFSSSEGIHIDIYEGVIDPGGSVPGTYVITYTVGQKGCIAAGMHTTEVTILPSPALKINPLVKIAPGESATLSVSGGQSYQWNPAKSLSCSDCPNPVASPAENQVYCVWSTMGVCSASACVSIEISCDVGFDFSAPNAFTPDGNGTNDGFCLQGWSTCIKDFEFTVFNRWGENVFRTNNPDFCWDGTYKGKLLDADVFVYQVKATYRDMKVVSKRGNIHLIR